MLSLAREGVTARSDTVFYKFAWGSMVELKQCLKRKRHVCSQKSTQGAHRTKGHENEEAAYGSIHSIGMGFWLFIYRWIEPL